MDLHDGQLRALQRLQRLRVEMRRLHAVIALQQDGWSVQERASMGAGRWFDAAELAHPPEPVFPEHLPAMLAAADARDTLAAPPDVRDGDTLVPKK